MWIDVELPDGTKVGRGPIRSATNWRQVRRLSRAGVFSFAMDLAEDRAELLVDHPLRVVRAYAPLLEGQELAQLGAGLVEECEARPGATAGEYAVSGGDLLRELAHSSVGFLSICDSMGNPVSDALQRIVTQAPGWSLDYDGYASTGQLDYGSFAGETVLEALIKLAEHCGQQFRMGANGRTVRWLRGDQADSGLVAMRVMDPSELANDQICLIQSISEVADAHDLVTAICAFGAGNGSARLTLAHTSRMLPAGYTLDLAHNLLINTAAEAAIDGRRIVRYLAWKEIGPISNSDVNLQSASNVLFDAAFRELDLRAAPQKTYNITLGRCPRILLPGEKLRVIYNGWAQVLDGQGNVSGQYHYLALNTDLVILESQDEYGADGARTVGLTVSTVDRWPVTNAELAAQQMESGRLMEAHPQLSLTYSPVGPYVRRLDATHNADFTVRIGKEVTYLNYAILRMSTQPLRSSVKSAGGTSTTTSAGGGGTTTSEAGGASTPTSSAGGASTPTTSNFTAHSHNVPVADMAGGTPVAFQFGAFTANGDGGNVGTSSNGGHSHDVSISSHTHDVSISPHAHDVTYPTHTHDVTAAVTVTYGIYQDTVYPTGLNLYINGVNVSEELGGPWDAGGGITNLELDITSFLVGASGGLRQNHVVSVRCASGQGEVEAEVDMLATIQAIAMV
jgi:hypothetical protein